MVANLNEHKVPLPAIAIECIIFTAVTYWIRNDLFLILRMWALGSLIFLGMTALGIFFAGISEELNPWIHEIDLEWLNFFTTRNYMTWLYVQDLKVWLTFMTLWFLPLSLSLAYLFMTPITESASFIGFSILLSLTTFIATHVIHRNATC